MDTYPDFDFPPELTRQTRCLVAFVGLDAINNSVHKNIWQLFSLNSQPDHVAVEFSLLPKDFTLPFLKPKKVSYEWYTQKGILKTNWMRKHSLLIPSVIVLFYELDWDDDRWNEKKLDCAACVHSIRTAIGDRNIKLAVVLIQNRNTFSVPAVREDNVSTEKASELCSICDVNPKLLLLLHLSNERLHGLENAFYELAQSYYMQEIRNVKSHKEYLNKTSHSFLFVRHQFKIAFLSEMKRDFTAALKHYTMAYSSLLELRITESNLNEIKTVASFVIYKVCKIYFSLQQPRDAISQFSAHIDRFRVKTGPSELIFEHYAWLSKQFYVFGNLFEEATRQGLPAIQSRHPGFYYEQAAQYAIQRKNITLDLQVTPTKSVDKIENDPLDGWNQVEFFGQRPWRLNNRKDLIDPIREQLAIDILKHREKFIVNHSVLIIDYLGRAISQFKQYRSTRKRRWLAVRMADEYYHCEEFGKALTLFSHMLWEYRNDKWWELTSDLSRKALNCAYLTANLQEFAERCVDSLYLFADDEKAGVMSNINAIIKNEVPLPDNSIKDEELSYFRDLWSSLSRSSSVKFVNVDMYSNSSFILCKAAFGEANNDAVNLEIWLRNDYPESVSFSQLQVNISGHSKVYDLSILEEKPDKSHALEIRSQTVAFIPFKFTPSMSDVGHELHIKCISLTLGSKLADHRVINLRFSGLCTEADIVERKESDLTCSSSRMYALFLNAESKLTTRIKSKISKLNLSVEHSPPNLVSEWYVMKVVIKNGDSTTAQNCKMRITCSNLPPSTLALADVSASKNCGDIYEEMDGASHQSCYLTSLGDIESNGSFQKCIYYKTDSVDTKYVTFRVAYQVLNEEKEETACVTEETVEVKCVNVFEITASFLSAKCEHISKILVEEPLLMRMQIDCVSPLPVYVENTYFKLRNDCVSWNEKMSLSYLKRRSMKNKESGSETVAFSVRRRLDHNEVALGTFSILWRRNSGAIDSAVYTEVQLPHIVVEELPLHLHANLLSPGWLRKTTTLQLTVQNKSDLLIPIEINIDHNEVDGFMFSGSKQTSLTISPDTKQLFIFNLFPLQPGYVPLPCLKLSIQSDSSARNNLDDLFKRSLPSSTFVMIKTDCRAT